MKDFAKKFYKSQAWKNTRSAYAKSVGGLCEKCRADGLITPGREVHHIVHLTPDNINDENITLNWDNLILLCKKCHEREHNPRRKRYKVDKAGRVRAVDAPRL